MIGTKTKIKMDAPDDPAGTVGARDGGATVGGLVVMVGGGDTVPIGAAVTVGLCVVGGGVMMVGARLVGGGVVGGGVVGGGVVGGALMDGAVVGGGGGGVAVTQTPVKQNGFAVRFVGQVATVHRLLVHTL